MGVILQGELSTADGLTGELSVGASTVVNPIVGHAVVGKAVVGPVEEQTSASLDGDLSAIDALTGSLSTQISHIDYMGETVVTPKAFESSILETANKILARNIEVLEIPYTEVSNESGGYTVSIG